jgi:1-acyl-sn-glycerol-3-phosphate acyltransferase
MHKASADILVSALRGARLALHISYGMLLAVFYPYLNQTRQRRILKRWSRQLLNILNIGIQIEGHQPARSEDGCLMVANHVSWLDVFVLNAIHPSQFIAKSEVCSWPIIGWLCKCGGTIFIERAVRRDTALINQRVGMLLKQGVCVGLFPEGTSTDGRQVGHFHSALIQPAIDAGVRLCPIALRYHDEKGELSAVAAFTGDTTLAQSIFRILRCRRHNVLAVFTPALTTINENRRVLTRSAQEAIAQGLQNIPSGQQAPETAFALPETQFSSQSAYALLLNPILIKQRK